MKALVGREALVGAVGALLLLLSADGALAQEAPPTALAAPEPALAAAAPLARQPFRRSLEDAANLAGGLTVRLGRATYREGEPLTLSIDLPRAGHLNLVSVGPDDVATLLFPNRQQTDNRVPAGSFRIPGEPPQLPELLATPAGVTLLAAFLSQEPLDLQQTGGAPGRPPAADEAFARLAPAARAQLEKLATQSFTGLPRTAPLQGGVAYLLVCAPGVPCDAASLAPATGSPPPAERLTPGILLEGEVELAVPKGAWLRRIPEKGQRLTRLSEGFVPRLYTNADNHCSIGHGQLVRREPCSGAEPPALRRGISEAQADAMLAENMRRAQRAVMSLVKTQLSDGQYAALCDFTYNVGATMLQKSTLLQLINAGEHERVPAELRRWTLVGGKEHRALKLRRERQIGLYFEGQPVPRTPPGSEPATPIDIRVGG
jgi:GH24 family phage-related lysozyme (muramidase)